VSTCNHHIYFYYFNMQCLHITLSGPRLYIVITLHITKTRMLHSPPPTIFIFLGAQHHVYMHIQTLHHNIQYFCKFTTLATIPIINLSLGTPPAKMESCRLYVQMLIQFSLKFSKHCWYYSRMVSSCSHMSSS
jgi:hypothetical protein